MARGRSPSGWRAASLATALFAITLNFLQPLAHAALMREGGPEAVAKIWGAFCQTSASRDDTQDSAPAAGNIHECCLGLAHAPVLAALTTTFVVFEPVTSAIRVGTKIEAFSPVGIRDGPSQPRAPPSFV
jgi:hypothetical protein